MKCKKLKEQEVQCQTITNLGLHTESVSEISMITNDQKYKPNKREKKGTLFELLEEGS